MPPEIVDVQQGSPAWFQARLGLPTASEFGAILAKGQGKVRRGYLTRLAAEKITGEVQERYQSADMRRGKAEEADAVALYQFIHDCAVQPCGFMRNDIAGYSPDGLVSDEGLVEVKSRLPALQIDIIATGGIPAENKAQVQGGLWISERSWCDYISYSPGLPLYVCRCERDEDYIATLAEEIARFDAELEEIVTRITDGPGAVIKGLLERSLEAL